MVKIVLLGSCRFSPYEILAKPDPIPGAWNTDEGYEKASKVFYPAIEQADIVIVYAPDRIGFHTAKDIQKAQAENKRIVVIEKELVYEFQALEETPKVIE